MSIEDFGAFRERMAPLWMRSRALCGGTQSMRRYGRTYLPAFERETDKNYKRRLDLASLTNFYVKARNQMIGEIFREDVLLEDSSLPDDITENIDRRGSTMQIFAERVTETLLQKSVCGILIDHPQNPGNLNAREEQLLGMRHYWTLIQPDQVIDVRATYASGREVISHVRWLEDHTVPVRDSPFDFYYEQRICVLDRPILETEDGRTQLGRPRGRIYKAEQVDGDLAKLGAVRGSFTPITDWQDLVGFDEIPFVIAQVNRESLFVGNPPLADIAEKNIQHWRQSSNLGNALEIGAFPLFVRYGLPQSSGLQIGEDGEPLPENDDGEAIIGPHVIMDMPSKIEGADAQYVEPSGRAYEALERGLDRIIREAELMALDLLTRQFQKTATEANYDRITAMAPLQRVAMEVERAMNVALGMTASARDGSPEPGKLSISKDFGISTSDAIRVQALRDARAIGDITAETYVSELQKIGALSADLDPRLEVVNARANDDDIRDNRQIVG